MQEISASIQVSFLLGKHSARAVVAVIWVTLGSLFNSALAGSVPEPAYSAWWGTECFEHHANPTAEHNTTNGYVSFRRFPVTPESLDEPLRTVASFDHGVTFHLDGKKFTTSWQKHRIRFQVTPLGEHNSAIALTVLVDGRAVSGGILGNMELSCWRGLESVIEVFSPGSITGSPPRPPRSPLFDKDGNLVSEPPL
jgi:hypothetical protein